MKNYLKKHVPFESLVNLFVQSPVALGFFKGEEMLIEAANPLLLEVWGKDANAIGKTLMQAIPELEGQGFLELLLDVYKTGKLYNGKKAKVFLYRNDKLMETYFDFIYAPVYNQDETEITGVSVVATEVTEQILSERKLQESEYRYEELLHNSNYSTAVYRGEDLVIEFANDEMLKTWDKDPSVINTKLEIALPELEGQPFIEILKNIFKTGEAYYAKEDLVELFVDGRMQTFYYNFSYKPLKKANGEVYAILNNAVNVTELVIARKQLQESENLLKTFVANVPMAVSVMEGEDYKIMISNETTAKTWGGAPGRIGLPLKQAYPGIEETKTYENLEKVRKTGKEITVREFEINDNLGNRFINYVLHPLLDFQNKVSHIISIAYDVTEDKLIKKKLKENEERFRILANSMPQIVWTANQLGITTFFNDQWYHFTGFEKKINVEESWDQLLNPQQRDKKDEIWKESIQKAQPFEMELQLKDLSKNNQFRWFLARIIPVKDNEKNILQWIGTFTDIEDFKLLQNQKDSFLAIASHELKTPLTSLKLYSQFMEKNLQKTGDEKNAAVAKKMDLQINKINNLINELLDVTKIQNGKLELNKKKFNFDLLLEDIIETQQMNSRQKIRVEKEKIGEIFGDQERISQVISNLINNAIKYSPEADEIIVKTNKKSEKLIFCVRDFGIGISKDKRKKVFEQYYRVSGSQEQTFPGMGLGLFISSEIIKRSEGKIYINNVKEQGSEFCFEIPLK